MSHELNISSSIGLSALKNEPQRLALEAERYNSDLEALVIDNYRLFVKNLTSSGQLPNETIRRISASMHSDFDELSKQSTIFKEHVNEFVQFYKRNRKTLQRHLQLVELLEVPQLVDACSRNGFHDEALELAGFVNSLERKHILASEVQRDPKKQITGGSSVIQSIVEDVQRTLIDLRKQLFLSLTENCTLPKQLYYLGVLRKLDILLIDRQLSIGQRDGSSQEDSAGVSTMARDYRNSIVKSTESRLQMDFLECRTIWLDKLSRAGSQPIKSSGKIGDLDTWDDIGTPTGSSSTGNGRGEGLGHYGRAIEVIEVNRTAWFETISHFSALFQDSVGSVPSASILSSWLWKQYSRFKDDLFDIVLKIEDGPSIKSILEQCLLFASRMRSLGCDFSEEIVSEFNAVVLGRFNDLCSSSLERLEVMLLTERFVTESEGVRREHVIPLYLHNNDQSDNRTVTASPESEEQPSSGRNQKDLIPPPSLIMNFPSVSHFMNGILTALNFLKDCPLIDIRDDVLKSLRLLFESVVEMIVRESSRLREKGAKYSKITYRDVNYQKLDEALSKLLVDDAFSHLLHCYFRLYPSNATQDVNELIAKIIAPIQVLHSKHYYSS